MGFRPWSYRVTLLAGLNLCGLDGSENVVLVRAGSLQAGQSVEIIVKK